MTALLLAAQLAATPCQTVQPSPAFVCVNGGWLPPGHPGIPTAEPPPPPPSDDCHSVDPYTEQERAAKCAAIPPPPLDTPTFLVGAVYRYGYDELRARVLAIGQDLDGVQVITVRWIAGRDGLESIRTPPTPGGGTGTWSRVP